MKTGNSEYRRGMGLKAKFSLWMVVFILTVMLTVSFFFIQHEKKILSNEIKLRGKTIALNVAANAEDPLGQKDDLILSSFVHDAKVNNKGVVYCFIVDNKNIIWASTEKFKNNTKYKRPAGLRPLKNESVLVQEYKKTPDEDVYDITAPIKIKNVKIGEVHLGISKKAIKKYLNETTKGMVVSTAIFLTIGVIGIFVLTSFIIGSVEEVTEDIEAIGNGDLNRVIEINRRDEIGRIAHSVKEMSRKLKLAQDDLVEKERMKKEMQIAKEIQQTLLPQSIPGMQGFQIETFYESANEVGGDYFDYIHIDETHFGILVADVSGKGVAGSLIMTMVRTIMRIEAMKNQSPHSLLAVTNFLLKDDIPEGMFITLFYVVVDTKTGKIAYCCAGHNPAFVYSAASKNVILLKPKGPPLGIPLFDEKEFALRLKQEIFELKTGDTLLLYTDGVTEAMNNKRERFTEERLKTILQTNGNKDAYELKNVILSSLKEFTMGAQQSDDITFVLLKRV